MILRYPLCKEITWLNPEHARLLIPSENCVWLDSAQAHDPRSLISYIALDPIHILNLSRGRVNEQALEVKPFEYLKRYMQMFSLAKIPDVPSFQGGLAGFLSYDLAWYYEDLPHINQADPDFEDWVLGVYDLVIAFDHQAQKTWLISTGFPEQEERARLSRAQQRLLWLESCLDRPIPPEHSFPSVTQIALQATHTRSSYVDAVQTTKDFISAGDIFEANLSQQFRTEFSEQALPALYYRLRKKNPAPFSAWLNFTATKILSASPERFIQLNEHAVETRPIKGTARRHTDSYLDGQVAQSLLLSEKDRAENIMIVDLMRNDLSKVCVPSSVQVPQLCGLESYAQVHHLVSVITGTLKSDKGALDLLGATFPGGSITGAPKIRAMEIIEQLEPYKRGPYCGSVVFLAFNGDMDSSIIIRSFAYKNKVLTFSAGGAVTADSDPESEYDETLLKAQALMQTLSELIE